MKVQESYNIWSASYDTVENKTRDMESLLQKELLDPQFYKSILELGSGTGKNTEWLLSKCNNILSVELSEGMIQKAALKINDPKVRFVQADINNEWSFANPPYDLISCSLVLEHIQNLDALFQKVSVNLKEDGCFYMAELHPFKQYQGSKARFQTEQGEVSVTCFTHNFSDYISAAAANHLILEKCKEGFDENSDAVPRILALRFIKK